jgi:predicted NBD/HSP70 family sugar kinase
MEDRVLCFDMGGKRIRAAVVNRRKILQVEKADIPDKCTNKHLSEMAKAMADKVLKAAETKSEDLLGIGFGAAGEWDGLVIRFAPNNPVRDNITTPQDIRDSLGRPTLGANDLKAAVHAVPLFGHGRGKGYQVVCAITYSDGNNIAILNRNRPYPGYDSVSQEVGHAHIEHGPHARWCGCGARGCFEAYVSGTAAARMAVEALVADWSHRDEQPIFRIARQSIAADRQKVGNQGAVPISRRCEMGTAPLDATGTVPFSKRPEKGTAPPTDEEVLLGVRAEHVYEALVREKDPIAAGIRETQQFYIAHQLAHVCLHHRPQLIELFGGLTNQRKTLFEPAIADLAANPIRYANPVFKPPVIKVTDLGDDIGLYGAASMVFLAHEAGELK